MPIEFATSQAGFDAVLNATIKRLEDRYLANVGVSQFRVDTAKSIDPRLVIGYGYDLYARRNNAETIIGDLTNVGIALNADQKTAIREYASGTKSATEAKNALSAVVITQAQADNLFARVSLGYETGVKSRIDRVIDTLVEKGQLTAAEQDAWRERYPGDTLPRSAETAVLFDLQ